MYVYKSFFIYLKVWRKIRLKNYVNGKFISSVHTYIIHYKLKDMKPKIQLLKCILNQ